MMDEYLTEEIRENLGNINEINNFDELLAKTEEVELRRKTNLQNYNRPSYLSSDEKKILEQQILDDGKILRYFYSLLRDREDLISYLRVKKLEGIAESMTGDTPSGFVVNPELERIIDLSEPELTLIKLQFSKS